MSVKEDDSIMTEENVRMSKCLDAIDVAIFRVDDDSMTTAMTAVVSSNRQQSRCDTEHLSDFILMTS